MEVKNDWGPLLQQEFQQEYYQDLQSFLKEEYENYTIYPEQKDIFRAFQLTSFQDVQVVILGQDPYHGPNQAHGLSFSVKPGVVHPPSLRNLFKELETDVGAQAPKDGYLVPWAEQGILMMNTVLTVRKGQAHSHKMKGWETLTDKIISLLSNREDPIIFILWGKPSQMKKRLIDESRHFVIEAPHPSPLSAYRGFFGSQPFSKTNRLLKKQGKTEIQWDLTK
ncbi:uracil-DNA glycosylase [Bacillus sp. 2205SS5-2]|uniref:uracil-DNA glycosylase n=1 Tax=Bacillus sp. 2205SS5-2 TaxID=3109031 RepID=UPI003007DF7F